MEKYDDVEFDGQIAEFLRELKKNIPADKPENRGKKIEYTCPVCGGTVSCSRSESDGHVYAKCRDCGFTVIE